MAGEVKYLLRSVLLGASLTASSTVSGLNATHSIDTRIRKVYRARGRNTEWVRYDVSGGATSIDTVFVGNHNFSKTATVLWQGSVTATFSNAPTLNVTMVVATDSLGTVIPKLAAFLSAATTYPHFRLFVSDEANADQKVEVGYVAAGLATTPTRVPRQGFRRRVIDPSVGQMTAGNQAYWKIRQQYEEITYSVVDLQESDQDEILGIYHAVGVHTPLVFALDPDDRPHHNTFYCQFMNPLGMTHRLLRNMNMDAVTLRELV
jgi:hypothetical protein